MSKSKHPFKMDLQRFASNIIDRSGAEHNALKLFDDLKEDIKWQHLMR